MRLLTRVSFQPGDHERTTAGRETTGRPCLAVAPCPPVPGHPGLATMAPYAMVCSIPSSLSASCKKCRPMTSGLNPDAIASRERSSIVRRASGCRRGDPRSRHYSHRADIHGHTNPREWPRPLRACRARFPPPPPKHFDKSTTYEVAFGWAPHWVVFSRRWAASWLPTNVPFRSGRARLFWRSVRSEFDASLALHSA